MGTEVSDLVDIFADIAEKHTNLDLASVGLFGFQYGGYLALRTLAKLDSDWSNQKINKTKMSVNCSLVLSPILDRSRTGKHSHVQLQTYPVFRKSGVGMISRIEVEQTGILPRVEFASIHFAGYHFLRRKTDSHSRRTRW